MAELRFGQEFVKVPLNVDSVMAPRVIGSRAFSFRTKYKVLRFFYIRDLAKEEKISPHYIPTEQHPADIRTQYLIKQRHHFAKVSSFGE